MKTPPKLGDKKLTLVFFFKNQIRVKRLGGLG
jgi:hypothetical protein